MYREIMAQNVDYMEKVTKEEKIAKAMFNFMPSNVTVIYMDIRTKTNI